MNCYEQRARRSIFHTKNVIKLALRFAKQGGREHHAVAITFEPRNPMSAVIVTTSPADALVRENEQIPPLLAEPGDLDPPSEDPEG